MRVPGIAREHVFANAPTGHRTKYSQPSRMPIHRLTDDFFFGPRYYTKIGEEIRPDYIDNG